MQVHLPFHIKELKIIYLYKIKVKLIEKKKKKFICTAAISQWLFFFLVLANNHNKLSKEKQMRLISNFKIKIKSTLLFYRNLISQFKIEETKKQN